MTRSSSIESRKFALMRHEFERKFTQKNRKYPQKSAKSRKFKDFAEEHFFANKRKSIRRVK